MLILIDRASIRKNLRAGRSDIVVPCGPVTQETTIGEDGSITITRQQPTQTMYSLVPEPTYYYEYERAEIECWSCGHKFDWSLLEDEENGSHYYSVNICPECRMPECCDIEFERMTPELGKEWAK